MVNLGVIFPPDLAPEQLREVAMAADESGLGELWLWEDCFAESGIATAAAVLAWTERLRVGIGLLPVPLRNVALTAMELATLGRLFPGRLVPGIGHGVLDWMGQVGARVPSPMTLLGEYATALRELLHGQTVSTSGRYVTLDAVGLTWPPQVVPPVLVGAVGPRTLTLAGAVGDGVILTGGTTVEQVSEAVRQVRAGGRPDAEPEVVVFVTVAGPPVATDVATEVSRFAAAGATTVALHSVGENGPPLAEFARFAGSEVQPLLG
ncbi:LLM class flavin-dependent oxidoreductase [Jatrophihabitans sp.]|jgi:alkanesulfonate monooxygenase SsuD/methylene tetrahydromethanopterin reductase-like flavin-dependent oxidoreductase (luciferase family)|uniref:LLM class flavin-dependent oxidoreductase n=1 Tax=Jatrophihabitans sp. TaxID=1932789 RepID=UPI002EE4D1AF